MSKNDNKSNHRKEHDKISFKLKIRTIRNWKQVCFTNISGFFYSCREDLIDISIETAVSRMQSVIELGRVTRERNTLPLKYPLKEVVAIHRDPEALNDIKSLQTYIMEELNVREVKVTQDKSSYGAHLVAEADFKTLGAKLKVKVIFLMSQQEKGIAD